MGNSCDNLSLAYRSSNQQYPYSPGAAASQITLNINSQFNNPNPSDCPAQCILSKAGNCGGSLGSSDISFTGSAPWRVSASKTNPSGYSQSLCLQCSNNDHRVNMDNWVISQCAPITVNSKEDVRLQYVPGAAAEEVRIDVNNIFTNPCQTDFPITTCSLSDAGNCGGSFSGSSDISFIDSSPWKAMASKTNPNGYLHSMCIRCSNSGQTVEIDNWKIQQCGQLTVNPQQDVLLKYVSFAQDEQILDLSTVFNNPCPSDFPITTCYLSDAGNCGGSFSGSSDISLSTSAPWVLSASKSNKSGYSHSICLRCGNSGQMVNLNNFKISQCGLSLGIKQQNILNNFASGIPNQEITLDVDTIFANTNPSDCPITTCSISDAGSCGGSFSGSSDISLTTSAPWVLSTSVSNPSGYSYYVCLSCTNDGQTQVLDNWVISQCGLSSGIQQNDVLNNYASGAPNQEITLDVDTIFANTNPSYCPITTCSISDARSCGGSFSGSSDISLSSSAPWVLSTSKTNPSGYSYLVCLRCTNKGQTQDLDEWKISQCGKLTVNPQQDILLQYAPDASPEQKTLDMNTIFPNPDPSDCPITTCSISDAGSCGGSFSGSSDISLSTSAPWVLSTSVSNPGGYSHSICLRCSNNGQTVDLDNWTMTQCQQQFPSIDLTGSYSQSAITTSSSAIKSLAGHTICDAASSSIILASDTQGVPTTAEEILSITQDYYLRVDYEKIPLVGDLHYVWYLFGLNNQINKRYSQINFRTTGCDASIEAFLQGTISGSAFKEFLNTTTGVTQTFAALDIVSGLTFNTDPLCQMVLDQAQILRIEKYEDTESSRSLYVEKNSIILKRDVPFLAKANAIYYFKALNKEFKRAFEATICGFETLQVLERTIIFKLVLKDEDEMVKYPVSNTTLIELIKSSSKDCHVESYWIAKDAKGEPFNFTAGEELLTLEDNLVIFNRQMAAPGTFSAFIMARTIGGLIDNYQMKFQITNKLNQAPQFVEEMADIVLAVKQKDQVEGKSKVVTFESPKILDQEGDKISIDIFWAAQSIVGVEFKQEKDSFQVIIDESQITATSSNIVNVTISDDGPDPKFPNIVLLKIEIQYTEMSTVALLEEQDKNSLEDSIPEILEPEPELEDEEEVITESEPEILPSPPLWLKFVNLEELKALEERQRQMILEKQKQSEGKAKIPVKLILSGMTSDGQLTIDFNQKLEIPSILSKGRVLLSLDQIDVSKILMLTVLQKSEVSSNKLKYFMTVLEWNQESLVMRVNFTNPLVLSNGKVNDQLKVEVVNANYFVSAETGEVIDLAQAFEGDVSQISIPPQLPKGVKEEDVVTNAQAGSRGALTIILIQLLLQLFLKGSMDDLFELYMVLQIQKSITIYQVNFPANTLIYLRELRSLIDFDLLDPNLVLRYVYQKKPSHLVLNKNLENSGIQDGSLLSTLGGFIFIAALFIFGLIVILLVFIFVKKLREAVKAQIIKLKNKWCWNNTIKSTNVSYLQVCLSLFAKVSIFYYQAFNLKDVIVSIFIFVYLVSRFAISIYFLHKNQDNFLEASFLEKYGTFMRNLKPSGYLYEAVSMFSKLTFVAIPLFMRDSGNQIQLLLFGQSLFIIWYGLTEPHNHRKMRRVMLFNHAIQMIIFYHALAFSDFILELRVKFQMGYSLLGFMALLISINLTVSMYGRLSSAQRTFRLNNLKNKYEERLLEIDMRQNPEKYLTESDKKFENFQQEVIINKMAAKYGIDKNEIAIIMKEEIKEQKVEVKPFSENQTQIVEDNDEEVVRVKNKSSKFRFNNNSPKLKKLSKKQYLRNKLAIIREETLEQKNSEESQEAEDSY